MMFDTGSPDLWVKGKHCYSQLCQNKQKYDHEKSSTNTLTGKFYKYAYVSGYINGVLEKDTFNLAGKQISNVKFGVAEQVEGQGVAYSQFDGVVGLGIVAPFTSENQGDQLFSIGYQQGVWQDNSFSIFIEKHLGIGGSVLILGGVDLKYTKTELKYYPRVGNYFWQLQAQGITINGIQGRLDDVVIDSGAPTGLLTTDVFIFVITQLGINANQAQRMPCSLGNSLPDIEIHIGDDIYTISNDTYVQRVIDIQHGGIYCKLAFDYGPGFISQYSWLLGFEFQRKYLTHYDLGNNRVGLAESQDPQELNDY